MDTHPLYSLFSDRDVLVNHITHLIQGLDPATLNHLQRQLGIDGATMEAWSMDVLAALWRWLLGEITKDHPITFPGVFLNDTSWAVDTATEHETTSPRKTRVDRQRRSNETLLEDPTNAEGAIDTEKMLWILAAITAGLVLITIAVLLFKRWRLNRRTATTSHTIKNQPLEAHRAFGTTPMRTRNGVTQNQQTAPTSGVRSSFFYSWAPTDIDEEVSVVVRQEKVRFASK